MSEAAPDYRDLPTTAAAYVSLHGLVVDTLSGVIGQSVTVAFERCEEINGTTVSVMEGDLLATLRLEAPLNTPQHVIMFVAPTESIVRLFSLPPGDEGEGVFGIEAMVAFGDYMSTVLETLVRGVDWLSEAPRALMDNLGTYDTDNPAGPNESPETLIGDEGRFFRARLTLALADGVPAPITLIFGESAERGLLGLSAPEVEVAPPAEALSATRSAPLDPTPSVVPAAVAATATPPAPTATPAPITDTRIQPTAFAPLDARPAAGSGHSIDFIRDVPLTISVELGRASLPVREVLALGSGSVIQLNRLAGEVADILVNNRLVARGQIMIVDDSYGVKITEIIEANTVGSLIPS